MATENGFGSLTPSQLLSRYINPQPETDASKSLFERESDGIPDEFETAADPETATNLGVRLDGLRRSYGGSDTVHRIIDEAAKGLRRNKREALLATIADLPVESYVMQFDAEHVLDALESCSSGGWQIQPFSASGRKRWSAPDCRTPQPRPI